MGEVDVEGAVVFVAADELPERCVVVAAAADEGLVVEGLVVEAAALVVPAFEAPVAEVAFSAAFAVVLCSLAEAAGFEFAGAVAFSTD